MGVRSLLVNLAFSTSSWAWLAPRNSTSMIQNIRLDAVPCNPHGSNTEDSGGSHVCVFSECRVILPPDCDASTLQFTVGFYVRGLLFTPSGRVEVAGLKCEINSMCA